MKKMAIGVLGTGALVLAAALGTSYYVGGKIQQSFEKTALDWSTEDGFSVSVLEYERGIIGSKAKTQWSFVDEEERFDITATHHITHGPWAKGQGGSMDSRFELPQDSDPDLRQALQGRAVLQMLSQMAWSGATEHSISSPEVAVNFADGSDLSWGGMQAQLNLSAQRNAAQGWARMPALQLKSEDGSRLEVQDTALEFSGAVVPGHSFWDGPASMKISSIKVFEPEDRASITLQGIALDTATTVRGEMIDNDFKIKVANMDAPGYRTSGLVMDLRLKNIDATWLDQVMISTQGNMRDEAHRMELMRSLPVFLGRKPEIAIERFAIRTPEGQSELSARLAYQGENSSTFDPVTDLYGVLRLSMPTDLLALLMGEKVRSDYLNLLEQLGQEMADDALQAEVQNGAKKRMDALIAQGFVKTQGDMSTSELEYSQGEFKLNGKSTPLHQLLGIGGSM